MSLISSVKITAWKMSDSPFIQARYQWRGEPVVFSYRSPATSAATTINIPVPVPSSPTTTESITLTVNLLIQKNTPFTLVSGTSKTADKNFYKSVTATEAPCSTESNFLPMIDTTTLTIPRGAYKPTDLAKMITQKLSASFSSTTVAVPGVDNHLLQSTANLSITTTAAKTFVSNALNLTTFAGSTTIQSDIGTAAFRVVGDHFKLTFQNPKPANLNGIPIAELDGKVFQITGTNGGANVVFDAPSAATSSGTGQAPTPLRWSLRPRT